MIPYAGLVKSQKELWIEYHNTSCLVHAVSRLLIYFTLMHIYVYITSDTVCYLN